MELDKLVKKYRETGGNISLLARHFGKVRATIRYHLEKAGIDLTRPVAGGTVVGIEAETRSLPSRGAIQRFIITSAQNNTKVHVPVWKALMALANHYVAEILVGTFTYNQNSYSKLSVKRGQDKKREEELWYDPLLTDHLCDKRVQLAPGLQWCGEMNILPTAVTPLTGFETYTGRSSGIFPHAKFAMRSIAAGTKHQPTKFNYTTGTVTKMNYIQKREGLRAEHHHCYGAVLVEINSKGEWWVRQLDITDKGVAYDLDLVVEDGTVYENNSIAAITLGDTHALLLNREVHACSKRMLQELKPKYQFVHDVMLGSVTNHWNRRKMDERFRMHKRGGGWQSLTEELVGCVEFLEDIYLEECQTVVVDSNHDRPWLERWLRETDGREDPKNVLLWLRLNLAVFEAIDKDPTRRHFHILEHATRSLGLTPEVARFLREDESFEITPAQIECGMHGHLGPDGSWGTPEKLSKIGRRSNTAHCHKAGIYDGLYVAGVSCELDLEYNSGPSSWSHSHVVTYPNGKRSIITVWKGKYRA